MNLIRAFSRGVPETNSNGTVICYFPATKEHVVKFDEQTQQYYYFQLHKEKNWTRIPWNNNILDNSDIGEHSTNVSYIDFGPECPKCAAFLGVGVNAWSKCSICSLNEPGSCMWSHHSQI